MLSLCEMRFQAGSLRYEFSVTLVARTLTDYDPDGAKTKETAGRRSDNSRVRVYRTRQVFHKVRFEENGLARHVQTEQPQSVHEQRLDLLGILGCVQDRHK